MASAHTRGRSGKTDYFLRKLHSLSGLVPVGAFLVEHFYTNLQAVGPKGQQHFDKVVRDLQGNPLTLPAEVLLIGLPLLFHGGYGLFITSRARFNNPSQGYLRNWLYTLQRLSGILLFVYVGYHVFNTRLMPYVDPQNHLWQDDGGRKLVSFAYMRDYLSSMHLGFPVMSLYAIGIAAACFHLANGLWNMGVHFGVTVGQKAQRLSGLVCSALFVALLYMGMIALYAFVRPGTQILSIP
jgi:succinate dehydrogenase / fumarate reductase cytochrome b subunit